jgi:diguanylate cyclase (GGDEF)-like protein
MSNILTSNPPAATERRRVLVAADDDARQPYLALRAPAAERVWEVLEADCFDRARFVLQMDHCDALLLDAGLFRPDDDAWPWLLSQHPLPALFVSDFRPNVVLAALRQGFNHWLPRDVAVREPRVLSESLYQVALLGEAHRRARVTGEALQEARRQVSRLVSLLWEATPGAGGGRWFTQRHMMERFAQEVARCERHGGALSVVLGEVSSPVRPRLTPEESQELASWLAERMSLSRRRSDIVGQYGPHGFMMLLPGSTSVGAIACCKRIRSLLLGADAPAPPPVPQLQVYFGVAAYSPISATVKSLLSRAEERLDQARTGDGEPVVA